MDYKILFGIFSSVLIFLSDLSYLLLLINGKIRPHLVTWLIWAITTSAIFITEIFHNAGPGAWGVGVTALMSTLIVLITMIKKITESVKKIDIIFLILSILIIPIWHFNKDMFYAVVILTTIDIIGYIPTVRKTYYRPKSENMSTFVLFGIGNILSILSMREISAINIVYQVAVIIGSFIIIFIYLTRKNKVRQDY